MEVMPSVLEKNWPQLDSQIKRLSPFFNYFQIDIADGILVDNKTVQIEEIYPSVSNLSFDFHLMVKDYKTEVKKVNNLAKIIRIKNIFIHFSVSPDFTTLAKNYPDFSFSPQYYPHRFPVPVFFLNNYLSAVSAG